ncbi:MAG: phosphate/phosphite/phosphonate ABC transporter substrate-binding protein [Desulfobacteraceae bacterium]|nr:phosphate/phosphite/phosphonate ABC transporter substrate-binding protein [Desulfobacteraceae bacterium]
MGLQIRHGNIRNLTGTLCFFICLMVLSPVAVSAKQADAGDFRTVGVGYIASTISGVDKRDAKVALDIMVGKIVERKFPEVQSSSVIYPDMEAAEHAVENNDIDIMTMLSINYLEIRDRNILIPKYIGSIGREPEEKYVLLVKKEHNIKALSELRNKKIITQKGGNGVLSLMWLDTLLMEQSLPESRFFFNSVKKNSKVSMAVLPVFFGQADACIVPRNAYETMVELNPQIGKKLNVLSESPGFLVTISCFRSGMAENSRKIIEEQFDTLDENPEYHQILILFHLKSVNRYKPEYLLNVEKLYNKYHRLKLSSKRGN